MPYIFNGGLQKGTAMKKNRKSLVILSLIAAICCVVSASLSINALYKITFHNAEQLSEQRFVLCGNRLKFTGIRENTVVVNSVSGEAEETEFSFDEDIAGAAFCEKGLCAVSYTDLSEGLYFYDFYFQSFDGSFSRHINLSFGFPVDSINFAVDDEFNLYVFNHKDGCEILKFSSNGRLIKTYSLERQAEQLLLINGKMYCVYGGGLCTVEDDGLSIIYTDDYVTVPCRMTGTNILCDCEGKLFNLNGDNAELCADFNSTDGSGCITSRYYLAGFEKELYGNDIKNPEISAYYAFDFEIACLYYQEPYLYAGGYTGKDFEVIRLTDDDINFIESATDGATEITAATTLTEQTAPSPAESTEASYEDSAETAQSTAYVPVTEPEDETNIPSAYDTTEPSVSDDSGTAVTEYEYLKYSSETYNFDEEGKIISGAVTKTTVSKFKKSFECNGEIKVYDKNLNLKTSGNVGTGMTVIFTKGSESAAYTICVAGDLTGEGNVNSLDLAAMFNHLLGISDLSPIQTTAADLNNDGVITNKDLVLIKRLCS